MDQPQPIVKPVYGSTAGQCAYCGAELNAFFYFCLRCGTPYKDLSTVVTPSRPLVLTDAMRVRTMAPHAWTLFWTYALVVLVGSSLSHLIFTHDELAAALITQTLVMFVTTCVFTAIYWRSLVGQFLRPGFTHLEAWVGLAALAPLLGLNFVYHSFIQSLEPHAMEPMHHLLDSGLGSLGLTVLICVFPAVTEEIAFRGLLQHWLNGVLQPWKVIGLTAILFMALHASILSAPYLLLVGLLLGWVKHRTGSLYPCMLIHFLHNWVVITYLTG